MDVKREPLQKISLVNQIVLQLRKEIISGNYKAGGEFPSEKELTFRFAASRHTVRSALQELAKEGLIEIAHGRGNIVKDYREAIGIDVFPDLVNTSPELITPDVFHIYRQHVQWLLDRIYMTATRKAKPEDEPLLLEILDLLTEETDPVDYGQHNTRFYRELLRIGDNVLLMMHYNSHINMRRRLLELGMLKLVPPPPASSKKIRKQLIKAICSNNREKVREMLMGMKEFSSETLKKMFPLPELED